MDFLNEQNKEQLKAFIMDCVSEEMLYVKRRIHRLWDAQEEMANNQLMILNRMKQASVKKEASREKPRLKENALSLEQSLAELERIVPNAYAVWMKLFEHGKDIYLSDPGHNLCVDENPVSGVFDILSKLYLDEPGYLLDIGCGQQDIPYYLRNFPVNYIYGMDPLLPFDEHPFTFVQNIAEFIPYEDEQFDYVVSAGSIDHVLLLDKALDEMYRVLKKDGVLLLWAGTWLNVMESVPYNPYAEKVEAADEYHMFHIAPYWLEEMMEDKWVKDCHYADRGCNQLYAFRKKV